MKTIKQRDINDCGVACVAMLADVDYDEAFAILYPTGRTRKLKTDDLRAALTTLNRKPSAGKRQPFGSMEPSDLTSDALVFVMLEENGEEYRHWIVWDAEAKKPRDPYQRKRSHRPVSYLLVG